MATLNLGRLKPVFRGSWNNATAYNVDDIVVRNNQSYISIQAGTNQDPATATAYWTLIAAKGTDGTDIGTTLTTQGDILYRDASGLARLGAGTSGQLLQSGGTGANVSWTNAPSGKVKSFAHATAGSRTTNNYDTSNYDSTIGDNGNDHIAINFTPTSATSTLYVWANCPSGVGGNGIGMATIVHDTTPIGVHIVNGYSADGGGLSISGHIASGNTNQRTIRLKAVGAWNGETIYLGSARGNRTTSYGGIYGSMMIMEIE